jgi:tetratricopeptide (TPR) repeat protein
MRRQKRFTPAPHNVTLADVNTILAELERALFDDFLHFHEDAVAKSSHYAESVAGTEILKFFRVMPEAFTSDSATSPYYSAIIQFILAHEAPGVELNGNILFQLAICHLALGDTFRAFHYISQRSIDCTPEVAFVAGFCSFAFARWSAAIRYLEVAKQSSDPSIVFYSYLASAICNLNLCAYDLARSEFTALLDQSHPCFSTRDIKFHIGVCYFFEHEESKYRDIMEELECDHVIHQQIYLEALRGGWENADRYGARLHSLTMTFDIILLSAYVKYRQKSFRDAYVMLQRIHRDDSEKNYSVWLLLGMICCRANQNTLMEGVIMLNNANALRPGCGIIERNFGAALELAHRWEEAETLYNRMIEAARLTAYAESRLRRMVDWKNRTGEYEPPEFEEIAVDAILRSPADEKLMHVQAGGVLFSRDIMGFLGDVEPDITEAHRCMSLFPDDPGNAEGPGGATIIRSWGTDE